MPSTDLIAHTIYSHKQGLSFRKIEAIFGVPKTTAHRWDMLYVENLDTHKIDEAINIINEQKEKKQKKIDENILITNGPILKFIKKSLSIQPFQTIQLLQEKIENKFNISFTIKMISRFIKIIKYSKKKVTKRFYNVKDIKQHKLLRRNFKMRVKNLIKKGKKIICLDESGINRKIYSTHGYSKVGKRLTVFYNIKNLIQKNHSLLMAINADGILKYVLQDKSFNGESFNNFVIDLINEKQIMDTYFLMDNVRFHKSAIKSIQDSGNYILFIPPYSPDLNPIEEVFSSLKNNIKKYVTPLHDSPNIHKIIQKYINDKHEYYGYYEHSFDVQYNNG